MSILLETTEKQESIWKSILEFLIAICNMLGEALDSIAKNTIGYSDFHLFKVSIPVKTNPIVSVIRNS